jgi:demethylmenaquinone methyltransferase/2-methoxy-6-polyprenyl-1,4-benzoquinol methylase
MNTYNQEKINLVNSVFNKVHKKYDLMNDIMSLGVHRLWKKSLIDWMKPNTNNKIIDVASGTGDLAKMISEKNNNKNLLYCVEPNKNMLQSGKERLKSYKNINWKLASAEKLPFKDNFFDFYTISFGIRNVSNINLSLKEARRVLKPGGRFFCLEFSKIDNEMLKLIYKQYSKLIPSIGKLIVGSSKPYEYLIRSIEEFYDQYELLNLIQKNEFYNVEFRNLSNGISAIQSGWKI